MWILIGGGKPQWKTLQHNGPYFSPLYKKHNIAVKINNKELVLPELAEEYATLYARYIGTDYLNNPKFIKNFNKDFLKVIPENIKKEFNITSITDFDLSSIKNFLENEREKRLSRTKEEKEKEKKEKLELMEPYMYCVIDGAKQKVGNYVIEPPGIFLGRGSHPKSGSIKKRITPEDVTINIGKEAKIPKPNVEGEWGKVIHEKDKIWLASWKDKITGKTKYIFTSVEASFKSKSDEKKFNLARQLKRKIKTIREEYLKALESVDIKTKQLATALYFIDNLALRVGGKKDTKDEADTVGVTSLRVEHLTLLDNNEIKLDFLGKDSIRYCRKVKVSKEVYDNLKLFIENKNNKDQLFDKIDSKSLNKYLESFMKNLTAKVWRTYNASVLFQKELNKIKPEKIEKINESERLNYLLGLFNQANTAVALLCNHQKNVPTNLKKTIDKFNEKIKKLRKRKQKIQKSKKDNKKELLNKIDSKIKLLKLKKETKTKMKNVSLGTSKTNYIDPRIIYSFIKKFNIPPEKVFNKSELGRFVWASNVDSSYKF